MFNLIRLIIIGILVYLIYKTLKWIFGSSSVRQETVGKRDMPVISGEDLVEDPYCHVYVPMSQAYKGYMGGQVMYFCSQDCFEQYQIQNSLKKAREAL